MSVLYPSKCQTPLLQLQYKEKQAVKKSAKRKVVTMTTLTKCVEHNPQYSAISEVGDEQFTFCQDCENNISRYYYDSDPEQFPTWTDWYLTK
jgi:hypothetical protein